MNEFEQCITIKKIIENNPKTDNTRVLYNHVCAVLFETCNHYLVHDYIDINIDKSVSICYCSKCMLTIHVDFIYSYLKFKLDNTKKKEWSFYYNNIHYCMTDFFIDNDKIVITVILNNISKSRKPNCFHFKGIDFINTHVSDTQIVMT